MGRAFAFALAGTDVRRCSNWTRYGVDFMEGTYKWHGGGIAKEQLEQALASVQKNRRTR